MVCLEIRIEAGIKIRVRVQTNDALIAEMAWIKTIKLVPRPIQNDGPKGPFRMDKSLREERNLVVRNPSKGLTWTTGSSDSLHSSLIGQTDGGL